MPHETHARRGPVKTAITRTAAAGASAALALVTLLFAGAALAQSEDERRLSPLSSLDRQYMDAQRARINEMTLREYGGRCCRREAELDYLQRLLDDRLVTGDHMEDLQAMGILLGDLLASELDLQWTVYEDARGRSRALQYADTENFLFPVTMISRRRSVGDLTPIGDIYSQAVEAMEKARPPLPFEDPK